MRIELLDFISRWGEPTDSVTVPPNYYDEYGDQLPELMLDIWREIGFAGLGDGLLWVCDPHTWRPIVDTWLDDVNLPEDYQGNQIPIFRTAYGEIFCFKPGLGQKLSIDPVISTVAVSRCVAGQRVDITGFLTLLPRHFLLRADPPDEGDDYQEDLFPRVVSQLGHTTGDTIYTFDPSIQEGSDIRVEYARIIDAVSELTRLRALGNPELDVI